ncbi:hypothetical protein HCN44_008621 [Aphidius gifuensis]|uniref:Charged multivesicular body protein 6 n=1 Tax=Aphidius gifuensis TaxID=684658 RepID=A0A834XQR8_APHGI|nr:charged multivesicular body protein 6-A [Aphidius gifuensis]XP_044017143.1 charged multivesicular body protein 6-A [Aphidius gifuensis]XP_044017144.1 charged multivesicular body protein 6-A [Aphidius gifuensis]KAF7989947.1 hypothetical protein HCN44_008621 [Aphidius gifuensis]
MGVFFSKKKTVSRITEQDKAVLQLKHVRDKIQQYQKRIEQNIEKERELAKKLLNNNMKSRALLLLRKKKFQEQILSKIDGQMENIESMVHELEFAQVEIKVIDGLKIGNTALNKLHEVLSIDEIEKVMDNTQEGINKQRELDELLIGYLTEDDEDEAKAELDALLAEDVVEKLPNVSTDIELPNVPEHEIDNTKELANLSKTKNNQQPVAMKA